MALEDCGEVPFAPYLVALILRLAVGSGLASAFALSDQITTVVGAVAIGVAAPAIVDNVGRQVASAPIRVPDFTANGQVPGAKSFFRLTPPSGRAPATRSPTCWSRWPASRQPLGGHF